MGGVRHRAGRSTETDGAFCSRGVRGGQGDFSWDAVRQDSKYHDNYLGHSVAAPRGRWAEHKDIHWYSKERQGDDDAFAADKRREELLKVKQAEEEQMSKMLYVCFMFASQALTRWISAVSYTHLRAHET